MDADRTFTITATKTVTATFFVYAEDEDDARYQVENDLADYEVVCQSALKLEQDDWDISTLVEQG